MEKTEPSCVVKKLKMSLSLTLQTPVTAATVTSFSSRSFFLSFSHFRLKCSNPTYVNIYTIIVRTPFCEHAKSRKNRLQYSIRKKPTLYRGYCNMSQLIKTRILFPFCRCFLKRREIIIYALTNYFFLFSLSGPPIRGLAGLLLCTVSGAKSKHFASSTSQHRQDLRLVTFFNPKEKSSSNKSGLVGGKERERTIKENG